MVLGSRAAQELGEEVLSRGTGAKVLRQREHHHSPAKRQKEPLAGPKREAGNGRGE